MESALEWNDPLDTRISRAVIKDARLLQRVRALAMEGLDDQSMQNITRLSHTALAAALSQVLIESDLHGLRTANWWHSVSSLFPDDLGRVTYRDVQQVKLAMRAKQVVSQADSVTKLRQNLLNKANEMLQLGQVASWRDVISGLRVIGVPQAAPINSSPAHSAITSGSNAKPPEFIFDEQGELVKNPAFDREATGLNATALGIGTLQINLSDLRTAYAEANPNKATSVVLNEMNEIVGVSTGESATPLTNMSVDELRRLANPERVALEAASEIAPLAIKLADVINTPSAAEIEQALLEDFK